MKVLIYISIYLVSAILVAIYFKQEKGKKDVSCLIPILAPMINTCLVILGIVFGMVAGIYWIFEHFFITKLILKWLNNGKEVESVFKKDK